MALMPGPQQDDYHALLRQQTVRAAFGELALKSDSLDEILTEACRLVGDALCTDLAKVMALQTNRTTLLVRAGVGWNPGVVGHTTVEATAITSEGHALATGLPMISPDIATETRFYYPAFLRAHGVQAVANVIIIGAKDRPPFGILQIDSRIPRQFTENDVHFLQGYANLIAAAVDRLRVVEQLRESEARLRLALEAGSLGSWSVTLMDGSTALSDRAIEILGHAPAPPGSRDAAADLLRDVVPEDRRRIKDAFRQAVGGDVPLDVEFRIRRRQDGAIRWVAVQGCCRVQALRKVLVGVVADVTSRRQSEDDLRQAHNIEAVGQLTGGVAHEFNNLLTVISGSIELLETQVPLAQFEGAERSLVMAKEAATRAAALTHRLLAFSRRQILHPTPVIMTVLLADMADTIRRAAGAGVELELPDAPSVWPVMTDPNQIENVLLNLCDNARDAMPGGGKLTIETSNLTMDEPAASSHDLPPGDYVVLRVTDTGAGMSPQVIARVFDPFFTTKPLGVGTGLGLSMVHGFTRQSGGQVQIRSNPGRGTTVSIYLPRHGTQTDAAPAQPLLRRPVSDPGTVLVADDEAGVRALVTQVLTKLGYASMQAVDGFAALAILQSASRIDLLITDVGMPGMNGRQLADAARIGRPDLKVLFITGYSETMVTGNGHLLPGMHLMTKPFTLKAIANRITSVLSGP